MHDTSQVTLRSKMPTPDAMLTAEAKSMIEDFHLVSHLCMSEMSGSSNDWSGEYKSYVDEALRQMHAAQDFVNKSPTRPEKGGGALVGHMTDLEAIVGQRVTGSSRLSM